MNILITGAFGFVGTILSQSLKTPLKHRLIAVDINEPQQHVYDEFHAWQQLEKYSLECCRLHHSPGRQSTTSHNVV